MAEMLMAEFHLLVARVQLRTAGREDRVELTLYRHTGRDRHKFGEWSWTLPEPQEATTPTAYARPTMSAIDVAARLQETLGPAAGGLSVDMAAHGVDPQTPLWLHLVKPYGALGALAWEAPLEALLGRSVLRLPDFTARPPENTLSLDAAVCCDVSGAPEETARAEAAIRAVLEGSPRGQTQVYVFAPQVAQPALKRAFQAERRVWVAPPVRAQANEAHPWFGELTRALTGRSIDYVHFLSRGASTLGGPNLALADPRPRPGTPTRLRFCSPQVVTAALTTLGAWAVGFTPANGGPDDTLRQFADAAAQVRPGGVVFARDAAGVGQACGFLFAPQPVWPLPQAEGMIYCHPSRVPQAVIGQAGDSTTLANAAFFVDTAKFLNQPGFLRQVSSLMGFAPPSATSANTPGWLAATQRFVESANLEALRAHSTDVLRGASVSSPDGTQEARPVGLDAAFDSEAATVRDTLAEIQSIAATFAAKRVDSGS